MKQISFDFVAARTPRLRRRLCRGESARIPQVNYFMLCLIFWISTVGNAQAATSAWTAVSAGYWTNADNWSPSGVPGTDDDVVFNSGSVGCTVDVDIVISSLNVTNGYSGTITFTELTSADLTISNDFYLGSSAVIVPTYSSTNGDGTGRVITVGGNATIDGTINGNTKGFPITQGPGGNASGAASHGGVGVGGPATYGSLTQPTALGSGGKESVGGGAIKLEVTGTLALNGTITVNAESYGNYNGAGGSIWLTADTFTGNGIISADGGHGTRHGGGGRVSIECTNSTWTGTVSVAGGIHLTYGTAQPGTLWEPTRFSISGDVIIDTSYQYYFPNLTTNYWNLTITNGSWVAFHQGSLTITNLLVKDNSTVSFGHNIREPDDFDMTNLWIRGSIDISNSTVYLPAEGTYDLQGDLNLSAGATLCVLGDTNAINEASGGTNGAPHGVGVTIVIAGNANIDGTINGDTKGFPITQGPGGSGSAASHGGLGVGLAATYGSLTQPTALGSGGGSGVGGGAVKLEVTGTLALNGSITVDGQSLGNWAGSGGSIWLVADTFTGNGIISADGGKGTRYGGGGRVSIECTNSTWTGTVSVAGGINLTYGTAQPGTLWAPKIFPISGDVIMDGSCQYYFPTLTTNQWNLTITNGSWVEFHQGSLTITNLLVKDNSIMSFGHNIKVPAYSDMTNLWIKGSIDISNSTVYLPAQGTYDLSGDFNLLSTGATLYALGDTNAINEASGGTNGNPHGVGVAIDIAGNANIQGTINGYGQGFPALKGPGGSSSAGGSYGGVGGGGPATYGSLTQPTALGSGGENRAGGGAIKLNVTGTLALNGSITADGVGNIRSGAGGSIWLIADTFTGSNGTIRADGGSGTRGGGGGRVSIECSTSTWTGTVSVARGTGTEATGYPGTYFLCESICLGAGSSGCNGITLGSDFSKDGGNASATNGVKLTRFVTIWSPNRPKLCWRDTSTDLGTNQLDNIVTNSLSGLAANTKHRIYYDGQWTNTLTSDASGNLTNIVITLDAEHTILVEGLARGTAIMIM